ncbi:MAG: arylsulfatase [Planctomyces sp.]
MSCRKMLVIGCWFACQLIRTEFLGGAEIPARPRIVFILADDLGYRELGCFGQQKIRTPNLDRLAARGMRLTGHYSGNAVCAPSRCVLLTGRHPGRAWIRNNSEAQPEGQLPIPDEELTIAEMLKQQGYVTGAFGKWGLGGPGSEGDPLNQGFDHFFGYNCQRHAHSYYPDYLWQDRRKIPLQNQPAVPGHAKLPPGSDPRNPAAYAAFQGTDYAPDRIRSAAVDFLRANKERPFFLYFPSTLPHVALHVPQADLEPWLKQGWHDPPFTAARGGYTPHFTPRAAYAAMISRLDSDVGVLLDELDRLQLTENTLVVFSADNGTTHLSEEVDAEFFNSVGELRGLKGSLYEGGVRVPTIVSWPGRIPAGTESDFVSGFEDWMPTLAEFTGARDVRRNDSIGGDGVSLVPVLTTLQQTERPWLYREFPGYGGQLSLRQGPWKLVRQNLSKGSETAELYNLETDPGERTNLAAEHPEKLTTLSNLVTEIRRPSKLFPLRPFDQGGDRRQ